MAEEDEGEGVLSSPTDMRSIGCPYSWKIFNELSFSPHRRLAVRDDPPLFPGRGPGGICTIPV